MRYTGSNNKRARRLGITLLESGKEFSKGKKRTYGPGQHGPDRKKKPSEYGKQLVEKQKLRQMYGVNERQFRRLFKIARASDEVTGIAFFRILESRLDNLVFRMGFAKTRRPARQLVNHGHITVNGSKVDIPSYLCKVGDKIALKEGHDLVVVKESLESKPSIVGYVKVDADKKVGEFVRLPERAELTRDIDEAQVIEYYNRLM